MPERFEVDVTFDQQRGYIASHPDLPVITALSLRTLRRRVDVRLIGEDVDVRLLLDRAARIERDARRASGRFLPPTLRAPPLANSSPGSPTPPTGPGTPLSGTRRGRSMRWSDRKKGLSRAALLENIYFFERVKQRRTQGGRLTEWEKSAASSGCDLAHTQSASTSYRVVANTADGEQQTKISCTEIGPLTIKSQGREH